MKKAVLSIILMFLVVNPCAVFAANTFQTDAREVDGFTTKIQEYAETLQLVFDYEARTDGSPIYMGKAVAGKATTDDAWIIYKFTYDGDGQILSRQSAFGAWVDRATLTYE